MCCRVYFLCMPAHWYINLLWAHICRPYVWLPGILCANGNMTVVFCIQKNQVQEMIIIISLFLCLSSMTLCVIAMFFFHDRRYSWALFCISSVSDSVFCFLHIYSFLSAFSHQASMMARCTRDEINIDKCAHHFRTNKIIRIKYSMFIS